MALPVSVTSRSLQIEPSPATQSAEHARSSLQAIVGQQQALEETKSTVDLILLTLAIGGLQVAWCIELAGISPLLLSLGLSKSSLAFVWLAGPIAGTLIQPYVGVQSDNCRSPWGRRKPFMVRGAIATMISLLALSWTKELVAGFMGIPGVASNAKSITILSQAFAVLLVYILDFGINVSEYGGLTPLRYGISKLIKEQVQAATRAFIVDFAPHHQQQDANAWAGRIAALGNIIGYLSGYVFWPDNLPWLGNTQFKALAALTCFFMTITLAISCGSVHEQDHRMLRPPPLDKPCGIIKIFKSILRSVQHLPLQTKQVCLVQMFAWIGWFPFLFYTTTYIGGIYAEPYFNAAPNMNKDEVDLVWETGTRIGTFSLLAFAVMSLLASTILPFIFAPTVQPIDRGVTSICLRQASQISSSGSQPDRSPSLPYHEDEAANMSAPRPFSSLCLSSFNLRRAWLLSHLCFAALMWLTLFVHRITSATVLVSLVGIPWAITNWAPFALIATEVSKRDDRPGVPAAPSAPSAVHSSTTTHRAESNEHVTTAVDESGEHADEAGVIFGIHNIAIVAPQVIATLVSSIIFTALQKPRGVPGDDSVAWVLRFGGLCALLAAWACRRLSD